MAPASMPGASLRVLGTAALGRGTLIASRVVLAGAPAHLPCWVKGEGALLDASRRALSCPVVIQRLPSMAVRAEGLQVGRLPGAALGDGDNVIDF